jgi:hypothetical protein
MAIRQFGPLGLLAYCVLNVFLSSGDRAVYYSPAEVNFLFSGPYRPRQLLLYKITGGVVAALLTALFMTCAFAHHASNFTSAYVGLFLAVVVLYLFSLAVGLLISTAGAVAFDRARRILLLGLILVVAAVLVPVSREALRLPPGKLLERVMGSPLTRIFVLPFQPFVNAFTSERFWPDLMFWSAVSAVVDLGLVVVVLALNAQFLEASASASARIYARIRRARRGDMVGVVGKPRFKIPMLPWWRGVGPNLWRQLTTASRSLSRLTSLMMFFLMPVVTLLIIIRLATNEMNMAITIVPVVFSIALFAPSMIGYDFRFDIDRMEDLKTLPITPRSLVLGQLATPVVILTLGEWIALGMIAAVASAPPALMIGSFAATLPLNLLLVAIENLYFLWFPFRMGGASSLDFQALGRQMLLMMAKLATLAIATGVAAGLGALVYYVAGRSWTAAALLGSLVLLGFGIGLIPLVAVAFEHFDVAGTRTE